MVEPRHALVERLLQVEPELFGRRLQLVEVGQVALVGLPEIQRIGQPRAHHLAVAVRDLLAAVLRLDVGGEDEAVGERRLAVAASSAGERRVTKHFWLARMVSRITSAGMSRNASSKSPISTTGHSTSPDTSSSRPSSSTSSSPLAKARFCGVGEDDLLAPVGVDDDLGRLQLRGIVVEAAHADRARRMEAVAVGDVAGADAVDLEIDHHRLLGLRPEGADDRLQRAHPAQRARLGRGRAPAHRFRPGEGADHRRHQLGDDLFGRPARLDDVGDVEIALLRVGMDMRLGDVGRARPSAGSPRSPARRA